MSFNIETTLGAGIDKTTTLVYGESGVGKTRLAATTGDLPGTLILSAEAGLLSLRGFNIRVLKIDSVATFEKALTALEGGQLQARWLILDSISEIAEKLLVVAKTKRPDPRQAYGDLQEKIIALAKRARDLPMHVVFIAKMEMNAEAGTCGPKFPGKQLSGAMPYEFDFVLAMRAGKDDAGKEIRWIQATPDGKWAAKDRSGSLTAREEPDLAAIVAKISAAAPMAANAEPAKPAANKLTVQQVAAKMVTQIITAATKAGHSHVPELDALLANRDPMALPDADARTLVGSAEKPGDLRKMRDRWLEQPASAAPPAPEKPPATVHPISPACEALLATIRTSLDVIVHDYPGFAEQARKIVAERPIESMPEAGLRAVKLALDAVYEKAVAA